MKCKHCGKNYYFLYHEEFCSLNPKYKFNLQKYYKEFAKQIKEQLKNVN